MTTTTTAEARRRIRGCILGAALAPLAWGYRAGLAIARTGTKVQKIGKPVISVGNLTAGGSGKTPLVIELVRMLSEAGKRVAVVSRGYRRRTRGLLVVHTPGGPVRPVDEAGDEKRILASCEERWRANVESYEPPDLPGDRLRDLQKLLDRASQELD